VDPWVGHQIGLELIDINTKSTVKSQGTSQWWYKLQINLTQLIRTKENNTPDYIIHHT
jgi:hypothetical protein